MYDACPLTLSHDQLRRVLRAGACPILEVTVTYPCLCPTEGWQIERFNGAYRAMAENLMAWAESVLYARVMADFEAAGAGAAYCFDRRVMVCDMTAAFSSGEGQGRDLIVTRNLRLFSRRGGGEERCLTDADHWRFPELTLRRPAERRTGFLSTQKSAKM